jgi:uncharacterized protein
MPPNRLCFHSRFARSVVSLGTAPGLPGQPFTGPSGTSGRTGPVAACSSVVDVDLDVTDAPERRRYEGRLDGELAAIAEYRVADGLVTFVHTEVMPEFEGKGVASALVRSALDDVRAHGRRVHAVCPFVAGYVERHSDEYGDLLR